MMQLYLPRKMMSDTWLQAFCTGDVTTPDVFTNQQHYPVTLLNVAWLWFHCYVSGGLPSPSPPNDAWNESYRKSRWCVSSPAHQAEDVRQHSEWSRDWCVTADAQFGNSVDFYRRRQALEHPELTVFFFLFFLTVKSFVFYFCEYRIILIQWVLSKREILKTTQLGTRHWWNAKNMTSAAFSVASNFKLQLA